MNSQYSGSLVSDDYSENSLESHAEDDNSITTEECDENISEEEQSSIATQISSKEELDPWTTMINDAACKIRDKYNDNALLMEGHDESEATVFLKVCFTCVPGGIGRCLHGQPGMG